MKRFDDELSDGEAGDAAKYPCKLVVAIATQVKWHVIFSWPCLVELALLSALNEYI